MNRLRGLYVLTDSSIPLKQWPVIVEQVLRGGAKLIQFREKQLADEELLECAHALRELCQEYNVPFIVNDRVELAKKINANGIHLGQGDRGLEETRISLGRGKIIGVSCHNRLELAQKAQSQGADYVAFGSVFASTTKPDTVRVDRSVLLQACRTLSIPVCAIGGITPSNAADLVTSGIDLLATARSVFSASQPRSCAEAIASLWQ